MSLSVILDDLNTLDIFHEIQYLVEAFVHGIDSLLMIQPFCSSRDEMFRIGEC